MPLRQEQSAAHSNPRIKQILSQALPALTGTSRLLLRRIESGSISFQAMSDQIKNDPVLALQLISRANSAIRSDESLVKTLSQAISLLGETFLVDMLRKTPPPETPNSPHGFTYQRVVSASFFCRAPGGASLPL
jgi:HD-like signal output (HDOD) protein